MERRIACSSDRQRWPWSHDGSFFRSFRRRQSVWERPPPQTAAPSSGLHNPPPASAAPPSTPSTFAPRHSANAGMLHNALQFLDERRRRFHRAETSPDLQLVSGGSGGSGGSPSRLSSGASGGSSGGTPTGRRKARTPTSLAPCTGGEHAALSMRPHRPSASLQPSPDGSKDKRQGSLESLLRQDRRAASVDLGRRFRVSPKSLRASPSVPAKLNRYAFVRRHHLGRHNSARSAEELAGEMWRNEKTLRDANDLFAAIDAGDLCATRELLARRPALLNAANDLQLTPLDVAVLRAPPPVAEFLLSLGAKPNGRLVDRMGAHLERKMEEVDAQIAALVAKEAASSGSGSSGRDAEKELAMAEQTAAYLQLLKRGFDRLPTPSPPSRVAADAAGATAVRLLISPPGDTVALRYRAEFAATPDFCPVQGEELADATLPPTSHVVEGLRPGQSVAVRVSAFNHKGWGRWRLAHPRVVLVSTWRDCDELPEAPLLADPEECAAPLDLLDPAVADLRERLEKIVSDMSGGSPGISVSKAAKSPLSQRKRSLRNLFAPLASTSRFTRHLKPWGTYLALVCHTDERVLVFEDGLPCLPIEDSGSSPGRCLLHDLLWLAKLTAAPGDLRPAAQLLDRLSTPSSLGLRIKLLGAAQELQAALGGATELGHVFPEAISHHEATVLVLVRRVPDTKAVAPGGGLRWASLSKLQRRATEPNAPTTPTSPEAPPPAGSCCEEGLYSRLEDFTAFSERCARPLARGLYLCYLSLKAHMDRLEVMVRAANPAALPSIRVRDNPHLTAEEWTFLRQGLPPLDAAAPGRSNCALDEAAVSAVTDCRRRFVNSLAMAWNSLQVQLNLGSAEAASCSLFTDAPLELSSDVSLILVLPSPQRLCASLEADLALPSDAFATAPLQLFDLYVSLLYRPAPCRPLAALAALLELLEPSLRHLQREAFSDSEIEAARARVAASAELVAEVEAARRRHRWVAEVVSRARERPEQCGASLAALARALEDPPAPAARPLRLPPAVRVVPARSPSPVAPPALAAPAEPTAPTSGTIRVFADYRTGLAPGTSVRLFLTHRTTAKEIVELVVRQLNKAAIVKDTLAPQYGPEERATQFRLVAVLGADAGPAMENTLPEGFHPLLLQPPYKDAKLVIRHMPRSAASSRVTSRAGSPCPTCHEGAGPLATDV